MKKEYIKPNMLVVKLQPTTIICVSRKVYSGDTGITSGGSGFGSGRASECNTAGWDEW